MIKKTVERRSFFMQQMYIDSFFCIQEQSESNNAIELHEQNEEKQRINKRQILLEFLFFLIIF